MTTQSEIDRALNNLEPNKTHRIMGVRVRVKEVSFGGDYRSGARHYYVDGDDQTRLLKSGAVAKIQKIIRERFDG